MSNIRTVYDFVTAAHSITSTPLPQRPTASWVFVSDTIKQTNFKLLPAVAEKTGWTVIDETRFEALARIMTMDNYEGCVFAWCEKRGFKIGDLVPSTMDTIMICQPQSKPRPIHVKTFRMLMSLGKDRFKQARALADILLRSEMEPITSATEKKIMDSVSGLQWTLDDADKLPPADQYVWRVASIYQKDQPDA